MCVETSWLAEMATDTFSIEAIVRGYHVKQDSWDAAIGEQLPCKREPGNYKDPFTVAVVRSPVIVGLVPRKVCAPPSCHASGSFTSMFALKCQ